MNAMQRRCTGVAEKGAKRQEDGGAGQDGNNGGEQVSAMRCSRANVVLIWRRLVSRAGCCLLDYALKKCSDRSY